ncbi:hypothetical protein EYF80_054227 [Liparis tanakae]|uniref:Uncharacterized protein n=1 Tax=Liparis tanakae TaxID=230148 RepID=A0A4Z2F302_9TELE|nr:hypothetical protein EYF80_054227 [Liparis tanakae]
MLKEIEKKGSKGTTCCGFKPGTVRLKENTQNDNFASESVRSGTEATERNEGGEGRESIDARLDNK